MAKTRRTRTNWANVLTWTRLALLLPITVFAYLDMRWTVLWLFVIAMLTDFFDGKVARWTRVASPEGAAVDSRVDSIMLPFMLVWLWLLFPVFFIDFWKWILVIVGLLLAQLFVAYVKLGKIVGLHLWSDKAAAVGGAALLPSLIVFGYVPWIVWTVIVLTIYSFVEEIIYLLKGGKNLDARWFGDK